MRQMLQPALNILYVIARSPERSEGRRGNLRGWQWEQGADCFPRQVGVAMTEKDSDAAISNAPSRHCEESRAKRRTTRQSQGGWQWEQEADCFTRLRRFRNDSNRLRRGNPKRHTTLPSLRVRHGGRLRRISGNDTKRRRTTVQRDNTSRRLPYNHNS